MANWRICCAAAVSMAPGTAAAGADIIVDQPHDFVARSPAERNTAVPLALTADDFFSPGGKVFINSITVAMIVTFPNMPEDFAIDVHFGDAPSLPDWEFNEVSEVIDVGDWNGDPDLHLLYVEFDIGGLNVAQAGRYWVVPYAIGNGSGTDRAWWGTAGNGVVNGSEGYFRSEHFGVPEWTPISESGIINFPTDFAMTIEATIPAPGALAVFGLSAWRRSRRRRQGNGWPPSSDDERLLTSR